jgi:hypothetical protein
MMHVIRLLPMAILMPGSLFLREDAVPQSINIDVAQFSKRNVYVHAILYRFMLESAQR